MATIAASRGSGLPTAQEASASHPYTCNTCQVAFRSSDLQKGHMRSDWHRYNLKRRVASLPPISSETFTEKVLQAHAASNAEADRAGYARSCDVCQKSFYSENSYQNHLGSHKHKARVAAMTGREGSVVDEASSVVTSTFSLGDPAPSEKDEVDSDAEDEFSAVVEGLRKTDLQDRLSPVKRPSNPHLSAAARHKPDHPVSSTPSSDQPSASGTPTPSSTAATKTAAGPAPTPTPKTCLFCNYDSPTVPLNATHMERIHGMFIPEKQYLVDLEGLIAALQDRIHELNECLYCGKFKNSTYAVQTHMRDKSHCKIPYTTEDEQLEIGAFYDFRSTYSDGEESDEDDDSDTAEEESDEDEDEEEEKPNGGGGAKLGARRPARPAAAGGGAPEEDGWETDSSASSLDSADLTAVPAEQHYHQYERLAKHPHHARDDPRAHHQRDGWHSHAHKHTHAAFYDDFELHLPSGKSVGHRSHNRYFRQNLYAYPSAAERLEQHRLAIENGDAAASNGDAAAEERGRSRALARRDHARGAVLLRPEGGVGMLGVSEEKKDEVRRAEKRARRQELAARRREQWFINKHANNQKYHTYEEL